MDSDFQGAQSVFVGYGIESDEYNELENIEIKKDQKNQDLR